MERTPNKNRQTKLTLGEENLQPLLPGFELATFRSRVRRSYQQAIPAADGYTAHLSMSAPRKNSRSFTKLPRRGPKAKSSGGDFLLLLHFPSLDCRDHTKVSRVFTTAVQGIGHWRRVNSSGLAGSDLPVYPADRVWYVDVSPGGKSLPCRSSLLRC